MHGSFNRFPRSGVFSVTTKFLCQIVGGALLLVFPQMPPPPKISSAAEQQTQPPNKNLVDSLTREVPAPVILCIDDNPAGGGQPSSEAYAKAAMNGFRSVLTLRSPKDGVDLTRERLIVEHNKLRYFSLPYRTELPQHQQVDEFLNLARDPLNQPMLVNCAFAERVAPLMMMFHILEQGWPEDRAVEEASRSGLATTKLRQFAKDYLANRRKLGSKPSSKS
jgi:protein tyrosine phosphatase (PTP) superfamily phosphohydrolase (DUF442 family)